MVGNCLLYTDMAHVIILETLNEDIFVCGSCKSVYNSLEFFLDHKRMCVQQVTVVDSMNSSSENHIVADVNDPMLADGTELNDPMIADGTESMLQIVTEPIEMPFGGEPMLPIGVESGLPIGTASVVLDTTDSVPIVTESMLSTQPLVMEEYIIQENDQTQRLYACDICKKEFRRRKCLIVHMKSHYIKPYQCLVCGRCFKQNSHLQRHISSHKVWPEGLSETIPKTSDAELLSYSCPYCQTIFSNYSKFRAHLKNHQAIKRFKCVQGDCIEFFDAVEGLLHHVFVAHDPPQYICYICNEKFNNLDDIAFHQLNHNVDDYKKISQKKKFKCTQCDAYFTKLDKLSLHMLTESHNKVCIHCNRTFVSDKRLRMHLQIHRTMKPYQCHVCQSSFHMKKYLTSHLLKHGTKTFTCSVCKSMYKRPDLLKRHMKVHQTKLKCPYRDTRDCMREFSRRDKLNMHVESHVKRDKKCNMTQENNERNI